MKRYLPVIVTLLVFMTNTYGEWGLFSNDRSWIGIKVDSDVSYYKIWDGSLGNFNSAVLANFTNTTQTLAIVSYDVKTFKNDGDDVTGGTFYYRYYKDGVSPGSWLSQNLAWIQDYGSGDQQWGFSGQNLTIDISSLDPNSTYILEVYAEVTGIPGGPIKDDNGGNNYKATFTTDNTFPVELEFFSAKLNSGKVQLNWQTATEMNNFGFEVQKLAYIGGNVNNWEVVGFVAGAGNSNSTKNYSFTDPQTVHGKYQYRLKQIDNDGSFSFSSVIEFDLPIPTEYLLEQNYPNPFNPKTTIRFGLPVEARVALEIYNIAGEKVATVIDGELGEGYHTIDFDGSVLASGIYLYRLTANDFVSVRKFVVMK